MRAAIVVAWLAACGGAQQPPPPGEPPVDMGPADMAPAEVAASMDMPRVARPALELAVLVPARTPPWPLQELPSVQPHLDVAMAHDACAPAFARRHAQESELLAYVAAWCRIKTGDLDAIRALAPLAHSVRPELARAARLDVIDLIADHHLAHDAAVRLNNLGLSSPAVLDELAATYEALGQHADARAVGELMLRRMNADTVHECERTIAWSNVDSPGLEIRLAGIHDEAGDCAKRAHALSCALTAAAHPHIGYGARLITARECFLELPDDPLRDSRLALALVHADLLLFHTPAGWLELARTAELALELRGAEAHAVAALEHASRSCKPAVIDGVHDAAARLAEHPHHDPAFDARLAKLRAAVILTGC